MVGRTLAREEQDLGALCLSLAEADGERPTAAAVDALLERAARWQASDVHVSPSATEFVVRFRLDGVLQEVARLPRERLPLFVQRIKVLAGLLTYRTDQAQDGRVPAAPGRGELRVSVVPTLHGEKAVVRLLDGQAGPRQVETLGWPDDAQAALREALVARSGLVVFSGPAGSGKTTAIYAALRAATVRGRACASIEEPVEAALDGVDQTPVDRAAGLTFAAALRAILRHDPEVIFVGEVRDRETAAIAAEAGLTGHLVLTTVHAGSAAEAAARLLDLGVEPFVLASALRRVFAQRLVRRTCGACARDPGGAGTGLPAAVSATGDDGEPSARPRSDGGPPRRGSCSACRATGLQGRIPLVEHLAIGAELRAQLLAKAGAPALEAAARAAGLVTLADRGAAAVAAGLTTAAEIARVLGQDGP